MESLDNIPSINSDDKACNISSNDWLELWPIITNNIGPVILANKLFSEGFIVPPNIKIGRRVEGDGNCYIACIYYSIFEKIILRSTEDSERRKNKFLFVYENLDYLFKFLDHYFLTMNEVDNCWEKINDQRQECLRYMDHAISKNILLFNIIIIIII